MVILKHYPLRHACSVGLTVFIAFIVNYYFSFSGEYWVFVTAFLIHQTTRGTPLRQGLIHFLAIILALMLSSFLVMYVEQRELIYGLVALVFVISAYATFLSYPLPQQSFNSLLCFALVLLIGIFTSDHSMEFMRHRLYDGLVCAMIGLLGGQLFFPLRLEQAFRAAMVPVLTSLSAYSSAFTDNLLLNKHARESWQGLQPEFPEWVYEVGFNPGLRSGFRFFLVSMDKLSELFFSMNYLVTEKENNDLLQVLNDDIVNTMHKNQELLAVLIEYFEHEQIKPYHSDFTSDMTQLEKALQNLMPPNIEFLDLAPHYLTLIALVRDIKDMRKLLLQLVMALPSASLQRGAV